MVAYRITSSTPNRFSIEDGGEMGAVQFDETAHASVTLKSFPALLASDDIPIADFYVDFTRCDESYFDVDPNVFWDLQVGDRFMRKVVSAKAIGYEERARVEGRLKAAELSEALIDYDGLSLFHNESPADPVALELSVEAAAPIAAPLVVAGSAAVASPSASVFPKCLFFLEGDEPMEDTIRIMNTSAVPIIYRVYSSVPTKFVMPLKDGVLDPDEAVNLSVKLKCFPSHPPLDDSLAKFNIEFVFYDDKYFTMDPVLFWREQGDTLLRKSVLSRAINWESREAIDTRKRSLSMAEVPTEFDGYQQMAGSATGEVRLPKQEAATSAGGSGAPEATRHSRRASLGEAVVGESDGHRERRQSMNVMLAELATTLDQGVALKKVDVSTSRRPPALSSSPTSFSSVMDEMKYFMRQASGLEEDELADNEPLKAAQQIEPAPTAVAVQDPAALADDSPTQATQRRVSWLRACELLRIMPATVYFKGMSRTVLVLFEVALMFNRYIRGRRGDEGHHNSAQHCARAAYIQDAACHAVFVCRYFRSRGTYRGRESNSVSLAEGLPE